MQRDQAMNSMGAEPGKVGSKDFFYYGANHGGETLYQCYLKFNSQDIWDKDVVQPWFLRYVKAWEAFPYCDDGKGGPKYIWGFGPDCDQWKAVKTVNMSRIDSIRFGGINNCTASPGTAFTSATIFMYTEVEQLLATFGGNMGSIFGSASS